MKEKVQIYDLREKIQKSHMKQWQKFGKKVYSSVAERSTAIQTPLDCIKISLTSCTLSQNSSREESNYVSANGRPRSLYSVGVMAILLAAHQLSSVVFTETW